MNRFYNIPNNAKKRIYADSGEKTKLPAYAVEKDWWVAQTINFLPPKELLPAWEVDYKIMQEQMIHGDSPEFSKLIDSLQGLKEKINSLSWKMELKF